MSGLLAIGGAHVDRRGQVSGAFVPGASNPGTMREEIGGGAFNALRNAVRLGVPGSLMSVRGGDTAGEAVAAAIRADRVADLSAIFLDRSTPSYTAILDSSGDVVAALADMGLYEIAFPKQVRRSGLRHAMTGADAVLVDANLPSAALERLPWSACRGPAFAIAISPAKVVRLAGVLPRLSLLFMNRREAATLTGLPGDAGSADLAEALRRQGLSGGVITAGGDTVVAWDPGGAFAIRPPEARDVADVTGAGDALAGATIAALVRGADLREALPDGLAAAWLALQAASSVPQLTAEGLAAARRLVPAPEPLR